MANSLSLADNVGTTRTDEGLEMEKQLDELNTWLMSYLRELNELELIKNQIKKEDREK